MNQSPTTTNAGAPEEPPPVPQQGALASPAGEVGRYGGCPICGGCTRFIKLLREDWLVCRQHRVRWCIGVGLFDTRDWEWKAWRTIERYLSHFREVDPVFAVQDTEEARER